MKHANWTGPHPKSHGWWEALCGVQIETDRTEDCKRWPNTDARVEVGGASIRVALGPAAEVDAKVCSVDAT